MKVQVGTQEFIDELDAYLEEGRYGTAGGKPFSRNMEAYHEGKESGLS